MGNGELVDETVDQRQGLVGVLSTLSESDWDTPSLCAGWRIREIVAHITMPYRYSTRDVLLAILKERGRFDAAADRLARRDTSHLSSGELLDCLRENVAHPWKPPGGGQQGALSHDVIHGLDITEALHVDPVSPPARVARVLNDGKLARAFKVDLTPHQLVATDTDFTSGSGQPIRLPAKDLLLICTARAPVPDQALDPRP